MMKKKLSLARPTVASHRFWGQRASGGVTLVSAFRVQEVNPTRHLVDHNLCSQERH